MLSNSQKALIKMAQREAALNDDDYREVLETATGARSSTDPRLGERAFDKVLAYMEAIFWRKVDKGELHPRGNFTSVFRKRGYWAGKNNRQETSRDRFAQRGLQGEIEDLERALGELGFGAVYCAAVRDRVDIGRSEIATLYAYRSALQRTLAAKRRAASRAGASLNA